MIRLEGKFKLLNEQFMKVSSKAIEKAVLEELRKRWVKEESPKREAWQPRKEPTGNWKLLRKTSKLQDSAKVFFNPRSGLTARVAPYAKWHQHGTSRMPQRQLFGVNPEILQAMRRELVKNLLSG